MRAPERLIRTIAVLIVLTAEVLRPALAARFTESAGTEQLDGQRHRVSLGRDQHIEFQSVKFRPKDVLTQTRNATWCGVEITDPSGRIEDHVAIGVGFSETVSCLGLRNVGPIKLATWPQSIIAVYDVASPNAVSRLLVVFGRRSDGELWQIDEPASACLSDISAYPRMGRDQLVCGAVPHDLQRYLR